jgi:hypothetical protein
VIWSANLAAALRLAFLSVLGTRATLLTFYPAVMLAALYGGLRPGLLATVLRVKIHRSLLQTDEFPCRFPSDRILGLTFQKSEVVQILRAG